MVKNGEATAEAQQRREQRRRTKAESMEAEAQLDFSFIYVPQFYEDILADEAAGIPRKLHKPASRQRQPED
jgi:hypothetical protein